MSWESSTSEIPRWEIWHPGLKGETEFTSCRGFGKSGDEVV